MSRYRKFDRSRLVLRPLAERANLVTVADLIFPGQQVPPGSCPTELPQVATAICRAREKGRPVILFFGGHLIKEGLAPLICSLLRQGIVTHIATNGSGLIHDFEFALQGATSESVPQNIRDGRFGMWQETGALNDIARSAAQAGEGLGEAAGRYIFEHSLPYQHLSVFATAWQVGTPATVHVSIGQDIVHEHPNCDGAAWGAASYTDFLIFAAGLERVEGGVFLNVGSAVCGPEVYLKALSMVRNVAATRGAQVRSFTTAVFDIVPLPCDWRSGTPDKTQPGYYFRPWKTILIRTVADGGTSYYICAPHRQSIPWLFHLLTQRAGKVVREASDSAKAA